MIPMSLQKNQPFHEEEECQEECQEGSVTVQVHTYNNADPKERHRHMYFEVTELTAEEVERRFHQKDLGTINDIESLLLDCDNGGSIPVSIKTYLEDDFDLDNNFL